MPAMRLLPRWRRNWAEDGALQQRISALQAALDTCKGVARRWSEFRRGVTAAIAALALAAGFALGVYREPLAQAAVDLAAALGLAAPAVDPATAAYRSGDDAAALQLARPRAEQGDPRAQALLGQIYSRRRGALQDDTEAVRWLRLAADQGDASALFNLGLMSEEGRGVPQDHAEAARWYRLAAEQGYPQAQYNLGLFYLQGEGGTPQDNVSAHMWFNLAAARFPASDTRNRDVAVRSRDVVAGKMTAEQIAEAQRRAREWKPK
jgi:TPR repeat protein